MNARITERISQGVRDNKKSFRGEKLPSEDFEGADLRGWDFRGTSVPFASFKNANLKYANFEGANCHGADFTNANLHRANFKDAKMSYSKMYASDLMGLTITLECKSFVGMELDPGFWYGWLMYALLMKPPSKEAEEALIICMGVERWKVLQQQYAGREL